jgi:Zn-dependent protease
MRILGFPVQIRPGFVLFMLLIVVVNGQPMGFWLAGSVTVFTLAHELGHAVAARRTGATASISLDFLAGYASYAPSRPLTRGERATIAIAGPAVQIVLGIVVLLAMGVDPLSHSDYASD